MAYYSIGEVAERCGINPVYTACLAATLWVTETPAQRGGHRQFDDEDILRIEEIKRLYEKRRVGWKSKSAAGQ